MLWCGEKRTEQTISDFFDWFGKERRANLKFVCSDMWKPYLKRIALRAQNALNILDRFHIAPKLGDAIDDVRAAETKELLRKGNSVVLKHSRWCVLKNPENLNDNQKVKLKVFCAIQLENNPGVPAQRRLSELLGIHFGNLGGQVYRSMVHPGDAVKAGTYEEGCQDHPCPQATHLELVRGKNMISLGAVEGQNNKAKVVIRQSYGFKTADVLKISLYHKLGKLPLPDLAYEYI